MKVYISGKISGLKPYQYNYNFGVKACALRARGWNVINPLEVNRPLAQQEFNYDDFMIMCYAMIDICDAVYMMNNWHDSKGARMEHEYAINSGKEIIYEETEHYQTAKLKG